MTMTRMRPHAISSQASAIMLALMATACLAAQARAADVTAMLSAEETVIGVPVSLQIRIDNISGYTQPTTPEVDGLNFEFGGESQRTSVQFGFNSRNRSMSTIILSYRITPKRAGRFKIPSVEVATNEGNLATLPLTLTVKAPKPTNLVKVSVACDRQRYFVGQSVPVSLLIRVKVFNDRPANIEMTPNQMLQTLEGNYCEFGVFTEAARDSISMSRAKEKTDDGKRTDYYVYRISTVIVPERPGRLDVGDVNIVMRYPKRLGRTVFGDIGLADSEMLSVPCAVPDVTIDALPTDNQPGYFRGAVGRFDVTASAKPTVAAVGDPITLSLEISGNGELVGLQPPPLSQLEPITRDFVVPATPMTGSVQGKSKRFVESIRPRNESVTEIPRIPFAYFDPDKAEYVTVYSDPIPIKVQATERLNLDEVVGTRTEQSTNTRLTEIAQGIVANFPGVNELLAQQSYQPGWGATSTLIFPPLLFAAVWLVQRRTEKLKGNTALSRRQKARRNALAGLSAAAAAAAPDAALLAAALRGYVADRCNLPAAGLTTADTANALLERGVDPSFIQRLTALLDSCDAAHYAGSAAKAALPDRNEAIALIDELERMRF